MKVLYMVRHAKSSWEHNVGDHKRPLNERGKKDAILVSNQLKNTIEPPQKIISSDANRAFTTAQYFKNALKIKDVDFIMNHDLYDFSGQNVLKVVKELSDSIDSVMIFGHNHAFTSIANMLGNKYIENVPTCGFLMIEFDSDQWKYIKKGKTKKTIFPKDLK